MYLFILILLLLCGFIVLLFFSLAKVTVRLHSDEEKLMFRLRWLESMLSAKVQIKTDASVLSVYFFQKLVFSKAIRKKKKKRKLSALDFLTSLSLKNIRADFFFGFLDPFQTGITCGIVPLFRQVFPAAALQVYPDFIPQREYVAFNAGAEMNLGKTLFALAKRNIKK